MTARVLIVDDDRDIRAFVKVSLSLSGYETVEACDGEEALQKAVDESPDIIVMDVMMPRLDGFAALRAIRRDGRITHIPVILLTARTQTGDKLEGFDAGADDYLTKPFDQNELAARIQATLRRAADMRAIQPLTGLPGNAAIDREVERRVAEQASFALMHADLNNFKAYNDAYGFQRGDEVLDAFARVCVHVARDEGGAETFVGHVGGDDFVIVTSDGLLGAIASRVCREFDELVPELYDAEDRERGSIRMEDRQGVMQEYPLVAVSIGVATSGTRTFSRPEEAITIANEMKSFAKREAAGGGSNFAVDRRVAEE